MLRGNSRASFLDTKDSATESLNFLTTKNELDKINPVLRREKSQVRTSKIRSTIREAANSRTDTSEAVYNSTPCTYRGDLHRRRRSARSAKVGRRKSRSRKGPPIRRRAETIQNANYPKSGENPSVKVAEKEDQPRENVVPDATNRSKEEAQKRAH